MAVDILFGYTGRMFDEDTDLQNNLNRWYDAKVGRWLSEDPIGFDGGDANLGRYVGNMPINCVDPLGLYPLQNSKQSPQSKPARLSDKERAIADLIKERTVQAAADKAWKASKPNDQKANRREQGFWIVKDPKTGVLSIQPYPAAGKTASITPGPTPKGAVANLHTHPNPASEGYRQGASQGDKAFAKSRNVPSIIRAHDGYHILLPGGNDIKIPTIK